MIIIDFCQSSAEKAANNHNSNSQSFAQELAIQISQDLRRRRRPNMIMAEYLSCIKMCLFVGLRLEVESRLLLVANS